MLPGNAVKVIPTFFVGVSPPDSFIPTVRSQNIEQSPKTISKEWMQDNIHERKMSTTLLWIISASTWGSDQTIRSNVQLKAARTENAVAKTPCLNPTGLYDPTKHKSILAVTYHLNRKQKSVFNATIPCPPTVPTEHGTITKHNLQRMNARPYPQKKDVDNIVLNASLHPLQNRNFTSVFDVQRPFRAKRLRPKPQNHNFTSVFDVQHPFRAKGLRRTITKITILPQFLTFNVHFVRKGCGGHLKITILPRFWTSDVHEMLRLSDSWRSGGTAPALRER